MKNLVMLENNLSCLKQICRSCHSQGHLTKDCPILHYIPDKEKVIKRFEFTHLQERNQTFVRGVKRSHNSRQVKQALNDSFHLKSDGLEENDSAKNIENFDSMSSKQTIRLPSGHEDFRPATESKVFDSKFENDT
jgi:hypothetical protein